MWEDFENLCKDLEEDRVRREKWRKETHCCANCNNYYEECGYDNCRAIDNAMPNIYEDYCSYWK